MKTKLLLSLILLTSAAALPAATNDLTSLLQQGLLDEEAAHDLHAAITDYQSLATQFDRDRDIAATAIYRLGECYRKLGQTNEAAAQYERIVREFPDQKSLATLSQQNLTGLGVSASAAALPPAKPARKQQQDLLQDEIALAQEQAEALQKQAAVGVVAQNDVLVAQQKVLELKQQLAILQASQVGNTLSISTPYDFQDQKIADLKTMIKNSPDLINSRPPNNETPLVQAALDDQLRVAAFLLDNKADVNLRSGNITPLIAAAETGHKAMVELLLAHGANVNAPGNFDETALHEAARHGYLAVAEVLLANHADVNALSNEGQTPLSFAAAKAAPEMIKLLLANKADPNAGTLNAPLLCAIQQKDVAAATVLLQAGANPNASGPVNLSINEQGGAVPQFIARRQPITPLWFAIYTKQPDMVKLLLSNKADPNAPQGDGRPLIFNALGDSNILSALLDAGAKVDAIESNQPYGYDSRLGSPPDLTPLVAAAYKRNAAAVEILLQHGADPNMPNPAGMTPLHCAAVALADTNVFASLLAAKADPNVRNNNGQTPLDFLKEHARLDASPDSRAAAVGMIDWLRQHGALDNLPDLTVISVSRPSANYSEHILHKGTNDWNHFTLLEIVAMQCQFLAAYPGQPGENDDASLFWQKMPLRFPDLAHLRLRRPAADLKTWTDQTVDLAAGLDADDCAHDVLVEWGDTVEIPEVDHPLNEKWQGFSTAGLAALKKCLTRHVDLIINGQTNTITLAPGINGQTGTATLLEGGRLMNGVWIASETSFWLKPVLLHSKVVLASSDLSRVKVSRRDPKTGQTRQWIIDCSDAPASGTSSAPASFGGGGGVGFGGGGPAFPGQASGPGRRPGRSVSMDKPSESDLWLRDGDTIEIPEKP